jgi:phosphotransferase system HPr-like phosphotransfer protein
MKCRHSNLQRKLISLAKRLSGAMMSEIITYQCELKDGIHARPAGHIERLCNTFQSEVCWNNIRSGIQGNGKSALSIVATDTLLNDACEITISGKMLQTRLSS